jgi:hypothetical protein
VALGQTESGVKEMRAGRERLVAAGVSEWWPEALADLDERIAAAEASGR